jgi:hypothetical protein
VRFQPADNSTEAAGTPLIRIYGSAWRLTARPSDSIDTALSKRLSDPGPAHFEHAAAAQICGDGGAQQQKCDAKSENQWHLPHVRLSWLTL